MTTVTPVAFYGFTAIAKKWQPYLAHDRRTTILGLTLMTWNVWYEPVKENLRHREILNQIDSLKDTVDVIALQEVTQRFLTELRSDESLQRHWLITDCWDNAHRKVLRDNGYGIMFLVNRALEINIETSVVAFPTSKSGRYAQLLEMKTENRILVKAL
jgi:endonuclease/exonuclease/phosphatase family metal-dependent hydrolase